MKKLLVLFGVSLLSCTGSKQSEKPSSHRTLSKGSDTDSKDSTGVKPVATIKKPNRVLSGKIKKNSIKSTIAYQKATPMTQSEVKSIYDLKKRIESDTFAAKRFKGISGNILTGGFKYLKVNPKVRIVNLWLIKYHNSYILDEYKRFYSFSSRNLGLLFKPIKTKNEAVEFFKFVLGRRNRDFFINGSGLVFNSGVELDSFVKNIKQKCNKKVLLTSPVQFGLKVTKTKEGFKIKALYYNNFDVYEHVMVIKNNKNIGEKSKIILKTLGMYSSDILNSDRYEINAPAKFYSKPTTKREIEKEKQKKEYHAYKACLIKLVQTTVKSHEDRVIPRLQLMQKRDKTFKFPQF